MESKERRASTPEEMAATCNPGMMQPDREALAERERKVKIAATKDWIERTQAEMGRDPRFCFEVMAQTAFVALSKLHFAFDYARLQWVPVPPGEEEPN